MCPRSVQYKSLFEGSISRSIGSGKLSIMHLMSCLVLAVHPSGMSTFAQKIRPLFPRLGPFSCEPRLDRVYQTLPSSSLPLPGYERQGGQDTQMLRCSDAYLSASSTSSALPNVLLVRHHRIWSIFCSPMVRSPVSTSTSKCDPSRAHRRILKPYLSQMQSSMEWIQHELLGRIQDADWDDLFQICPVQET